MKRFFILLYILAHLFFVSAAATYAQDGDREQYEQDYINNARITQILNDAESPIGYANLRITSIEDFINILLPYLLTIAGLILFAMLIWGGFEMLTAASDSKKADAGKTRITQAVIGFIIIFSAYWITQLVEIILGVNILN